MSACPKCGRAVVAGASACSKCGLAVAKMATFAQSRDADVPEPLVKAWEYAVEAWADEARHEEVLRLIRQNDAYAWGAAKYASRAGEPIADKYVERVRKAAEVTLLSSGAARDVAAKNPYKNTLTLLVIILLAVAGATLYAYLRASKPQPTPPASIETTGSGIN